MARILGNLNAVNDEVVIPLPEDFNGVIALQYPTGGTGTVVVEAQLEETKEWIGVKLKNVTTVAEVDNAAASGIYAAEIYGYRRVRARKSVTAGACDVVLAANRF